MIHYLLSAINPARAKQVEQQDRVIYTVSFVISCAWLLMLFLSDGFRSWQKWVPGGIVTVVVLCLAIIGISAYLLH